MSQTLLVVSGIASAALGAFGITMVAVQAPGIDPALPWKEIGSIGLAGAIVCVGGYFLKREGGIRSELMKIQSDRDQMHTNYLRDRDAVTKDIVEKFSATATGITKTFAESSAASDLRAERREDALRDLLHNLTKDRA